MVEDQVDVKLTDDFLAVDGYDHVASDGDLAHACFRDTIATLNAGSCGRSALRCSLHEQTLFHGQIQRFAQPAADGQRFHAEKGAVHAAVGHEIVGNVLCGVDGNGEADAGGGAAGGVNRGVDANDFAVRIDERAAGIAAVDGGVGLDGFVNESGLAGLHGASDGADYAGGERGLEAERITDGENFLAHLERSGISQRQRREVLSLGIDFQESDVVALVGADEFCRVVGLIAEHNFDGLGAFDDVEIGEDVAAGINYKTGAGAFDGDRVHEEIIFRRLGENVGHGRG